MARNRKNESAAAGVAPVLKAVLLCAFITLAGVGYVWYKSQTKILGDEVKRCENKLKDLQLKNTDLENRLKDYSSPVSLEQAVKKMNLDKTNSGLGPSALSQVVRLVESSPEPAPSAKANFSGTDAPPIRPALQRSN